MIGVCTGWIVVTVEWPGFGSPFSLELRQSVVVGGFAEVSPAGLTILADRAVPREDYDTAVLAEEIKDTEEDVADAEEAERDRLVRRLDQLKSLQAALAQ